VLTFRCRRVCSASKNPRRACVPSCSAANILYQCVDMLPEPIADRQTEVALSKACHVRI
jgi:hypothetical protein